MRDKEHFIKLRPAVVAAFLYLACPLFAQDAPHPQPAPGLTQQKPATTGSGSQQTAPAAGSSTANPQSETIIPAAAERHFHQGVLFERDGNIENAVEEYKAAIKAYPDYFKAHVNLGLIYTDRKGYTEAIKELKIAASLKPDNADVHNSLG